MPRKKQTVKEANIRALNENPYVEVDPTAKDAKSSCNHPPSEPYVPIPDQPETEEIFIEENNNDHRKNLDTPVDNPIDPDEHLLLENRNPKRFDNVTLTILNTVLNKDFLAYDLKALLLIQSSVHKIISTMVFDAKGDKLSDLVMFIRENPDHDFNPEIKDIKNET